MFRGGEWVFEIDFPFAVLTPLVVGDALSIRPCAPFSGLLLRCFDLPLVWFRVGLLYPFCGIFPESGHWGCVCGGCCFTFVSQKWPFVGRLYPKMGRVDMTI